MKGIVLENKKYYSTVLTSDGRFLNVKRKQFANIGDELSFDETSIMTANLDSMRSSIIRVCSIAAVFLLVCMSVFTVYQFNEYNSAVYAYISMDINPSLELAINKRQRVLEVQPMNADAEKLLKGLNLKNAHVQEAVRRITEKSAEDGYLSGKKDNFVIMATSASQSKGITAEEAAKLSDALEKAGNEVLTEKGMKGLVEVIRANPELRNGAQDKGLSLGKYVIYTKALGEGYKVDIEDFKSQSMSNAVRKAGGDIKEIIYQKKLEEEQDNANSEKNKEEKQIGNKEDKKQEDKNKEQKQEDKKQDDKQDNKQDDKKQEDNRQGQKQEDLKKEQNDTANKKDTDKKEAAGNENNRNEVKNDRKDDDKKDLKAEMKNDEKKDKASDKKPNN